MLPEFSRIVKECFWDMNYSEKDIEKILNGSDSVYRKLLFDKILGNSTRMLYDLKVFPINELAIFLEETRIPRFNGEYLSRRKNIAEVFFLNKPLKIVELKWPV